MEQPGIEIQSVELSDNIVIKYANDTIETLPKNIDTWKAFHTFWLKDNPPFISDLHKITMRNIILASINNNQQSMEELQRYFSSPNEDQVTKFFIYMRKREEILPAKKAIWTTKI